MKNKCSSILNNTVILARFAEASARRACPESRPRSFVASLLRMTNCVKKLYAVCQISNGFTLVELLVVIAIMGIVGIVAFANYGNLKKDQDLRAAASSIHSLIRLAQANSTARLKCGNDITGSGADWIISFASDRITINLNCQIGANPIVPDVVPPIVLANNITIDSISGDIGCNGDLPVTVTYSPLYGGVSFTDALGVCTLSSKISINLKDSEGNIKTIIVNKGGSVEIGEGGVTGIPPSPSPTSGPTPTTGPTPTSPPPSCTPGTNVPFIVSATNDDVNVSRVGSTYPPSGSFTINSNTPDFNPARGFISPDFYQIDNGMIRWDTSTIPDTAIVTSATFRGYVSAKNDDDTGRMFTAEWYPSTNWPIDNTDWTATFGANAHAGTSLAVIVLNANNDFVLQNAAANINKMDYTGLRLHINGLQPSGFNSVSFKTFNQAINPKPTLLVTYSCP